MEIEVDGRRDEQNKKDTNYSTDKVQPENIKQQEESSNYVEHGNVLENVAFSNASYKDSYEHDEKVKSVEAMIREALKEKSWSDQQIESTVEGLEIDLLDPKYVEIEKDNLFRTYNDDIEEAKEKYYEEFCNLKYGKGSKSSFGKLRKLEERIKNVNSEVERYCYWGITITDVQDVEKVTYRLCGFLKEGLSEDEYKGLTALVKEYLKSYRNPTMDLDLEKILYDAEKSTMQPFPLEGREKVNYFAGRIYATLAPITGNGFREAINYLSQCSPEAFCIISKSSGLHFSQTFRNGPGYEDIVNLMIGKADMPRWLNIGFLPIKDPVLRKLVSATMEYRDHNYENARDAYKALYDFAQKKNDKTVADYVAIMVANCENTMIREKMIPHYIYFSLENNGKVFTWLEKSKSRFAESLLEGLRASIREKQEKSKRRIVE